MRVYSDQLIEPLNIPSIELNFERVNRDRNLKIKSDLTFAMTALLKKLN